MPESSFDMARIARELNERAHAHRVGGLQFLRAAIKGLKRRPGRDIFGWQTIRPEWAFHLGGRSELQFNIGLEDARGYEELRHGVAFSFETSRSFPNIDVLFPKVRLFDDYLRLYPDRFADMRMWHYRGPEPSYDYPPGPVMPELVTVGAFVFLGKRQPVEHIDYEAILDDFDRLLALYSYVEGEGREQSEPESVGQGFVFRPGVTEKASAAAASLVERELSISLRHNLLQKALCQRLIADHGRDNVADELATGLGTQIDVVVRRGDEEYWFYEIKTAYSPRACLRQALGQLLEYAYWPGAREASRLVICGEGQLDDDGKAYLELLQTRFGLPIAYEQVSIPI